MTDPHNGRCALCDAPLGVHNAGRLCLYCTKHRPRTPVAADAQRRRIARESNALERWRQELEAKYAPVAPHLRSRKGSLRDGLANDDPSD